MILDLLNKHLPRALDNQLRDAVSSFTATGKVIVGGYDPVSDTYSDSSTGAYVGRGIFDNYSVEEIQASQIDVTDVKLWCLQTELTQKPEVDDVVVRPSGWEGRVISIEADPVGASWTIQLRGVS